MKKFLAFIFLIILSGCSNYKQGSEKDVKDTEKDIYIKIGKDKKDVWIPPVGCTDNDLDQYGNGCPKGEDCDDTNPNFNTFCPDCNAEHYAGCPCAEGTEPEKCFEADKIFIGIGECNFGWRYCNDGYFSKCEGQVLPISEFCDGKDNDCDGVTDNGVLSPCGDCNQNCVLLKLGPDGDEKFNPTPENSESVSLNDEEYLILNTKKKNLHFIWISNSGEHTVSKIDTKTGWELGRYYTCNDPSRTAVDLDGDVWVACRGDGSVAKISLWEEGCIDKNGDGLIQTSKDSNNNHIIDGGEVLPSGQDECVIFVVQPHGNNALARAAGVDKENYGWIGFWNIMMLSRFEPKTGNKVKDIKLQSRPYGLAIDNNGIIWISGREQDKLVRVDPVNNKIKEYSVPQSGEPYGIAIDFNGNIWMGNCCGWNGAIKFIPDKDNWEVENWQFVETHSRPRGIAASMEGFVVVANDESHQVAKIDIATNTTVAYIDLGSGRYPIGMAIDFEGYIWAINQNGSTATKIDPKTNGIAGEYPTGKKPYTYSDMTGYALHTVVAPKGYYQHIFGDFETERMLWEELTVIADTPAETYLKVRVRSADELEELKKTEWSKYYGPYPPEKFPLNLFNVPNLKGKLLQVEVSLYSSDLKTTPVVKGIVVKVTKEQN